MGKGEKEESVPRCCLALFSSLPHFYHLTFLSSSWDLFYSFYGSAQETGLALRSCPQETLFDFWALYLLLRLCSIMCLLFLEMSLEISFSWSMFQVPQPVFQIMCFLDSHQISQGGSVLLSQTSVFVLTARVLLLLLEWKVLTLFAFKDCSLFDSLWSCY